MDRAPYAPVDYSMPSAYGGNQYQQQGYASSHGGQDGPHQPLHRHSASSLTRRPVSDPNDIDFGQLNLTSYPANAQGQGQGQGQVPSQPPTPGSAGSGGIARQQSMPNHEAYHPRQLPPRQRAVTSDYPANNDGASSVYSLDTGMNAYAPRGSGYGGYPPHPAQSQQQQPAAADYSNPYYTAANDFLGMPPGAGAGGAPPQPPPPPSHTSSSSSHHLPMRQRSTVALNRTNTTMTSASGMSGMSAASASSVSLGRVPTEVVGASSTRRRGLQAAVDLNKPPYTKQYVDDYRKRMKDDPDPEAQFAFAKYLIEAAKKIGDELSEKDVKLGRKYRDHLLQESLRTVKKSAESKEPYPDAQFFLANLYGTGQLGLQVDHEKAYYLYLMASKLNHPASTYRSAVCNEIGAGTKRDANRAVLFYRKAAALGDTAAMYKLAMILLNGMLGHPRNPREAIVWLRRAAAQADMDNPHALHELAMLHERPNGNVLPLDPHLARDYYMQAAQLGYAPSQFKLGACHEFGHLGCPIDPRKSIGWYTRAAEKGDSEAELALSGWYLTGSEGVLKQSDHEAFLWGRKAAYKGLAKAEYAVGCKFAFLLSDDLTPSPPSLLHTSAPSLMSSTPRNIHSHQTTPNKGSGPRQV